MGCWENGQTGMNGVSGVPDEQLGVATCGFPFSAGLWVEPGFIPVEASSKLEMDAPGLKKKHQGAGGYFYRMGA